MMGEWRSRWTAHRIEAVGTFPDVYGLLEPKRKLRHEMKEERRGRDGTCRGADDRGGANDVRLRVALFRSAQNPRQQRCARLTTHIHTSLQRKTYGTSTGPCTFCGVIARISFSSPSCSGGISLLPNEIKTMSTTRTYIPDFAARVVFPLLPVVHKYRHSTRVQKDGRGLLVLFNARLVPS